MTKLWAFGLLAAALAGCKTDDDADDDGVPDDIDCDDEDEDVGGPTTWYGDADGDGFAGDGLTTEACEAPIGFLATAEDCDDLDPAVHPGATELCNEVDDDCDALLDDADPDIDPDELSTWYPDADQDGYGDEALGEQACPKGAGWTDQGGDCDDHDDDVNPDGVELCDGSDEDCDGVADNGVLCPVEDVLGLTDISIWTLAIDSAEDRVYWVDRSFGHTGGVYRVGRDGTGMQTLYTGDDPRGIALGEQHVFFGGSDGVFGVPRGGGALEVMVDFTDDTAREALLGADCGAYVMLFVYDVAVEDDTLWATTGATECHPLLSVGTDGTGATGYPVSGSSTASYVLGSGLAVREGEAWLTRPVAVRRAGAAVVDTIVDDALSAEGVAITEDQVVYQAYTSMVVMDRDGANARTLDEWTSCGAGHYPWNVEVMGDRVYYLEGCSEEVRSAPLAGGEVQVHATGVHATAIAVEPGWLWWGQIDGYDGTLRRVRIPMAVD